MQELYEKIGLFYLGKDVNNDSEETVSLTLLKNKWLTTHAAIIGMTGSGKTGLGVALIEEAAIDNIPAVVIDPKGDMADLCLTDPEFKAESFLPWVEDEAEAKGVDAQTYAEKTARKWKEGIESWYQDAARVERFHRVEKVIYTPGSNAGVSVNILSSLEAPSEAIMEDGDTFASYLKSTVTGLLSLIGEKSEADAPAYVLTARIIAAAWRRGENLTLESLIGAIVSPPFKKLGVLPLERFFPQKERLKLANRFNAVIASPGFERWLEGETLDMERMLYDKEGKARIAIFSIAHLNDEERMFFVTLLLNRYIAWMRRQSGTSRLRTLLYMDEIFGYFPPNANPPSKEPMLLLLKQARAFGTGIVLSTQNPVDLDYKGLSNIGTWFIGRLQTKQDIERIIDGLKGKLGDTMDSKRIAETLMGLQSRTFMLKSVHMDALRLFSTRWVMSYLKGPLKRDEIRRLSAPYKKREEEHTDTPQNTAVYAPAEDTFVEPLDESIPVFYEQPLASPASYTPTLGAEVRIRFFNQRRGIDKTTEEILTLPLDAESAHIDWAEAQNDDEPFDRFLKRPPQSAKFAPLPQIIRRDKGLRTAIKELKNHLYATRRMETWRCKALKLDALPDETYASFLARVDDVLESKKDEAVEKLQERYEKKEKRLKERIARAQAKVEKEEHDTTGSLIDTGIAILGALFGRKSTASIGRTISKGSKVLKERDDLSRAKAQLETLLEEMELLEAEFEEKLEEIAERYTRENYPVETALIRPRKSDIDVALCAVVWRIDAK
jgi:hypothetical protein